jgi:TolB-like protein
VVGKAELMKLVWPDCVVEEIGLARNISILRKALSDDAGTYIETIPKRGYRFSAELDDSPVEPRQGNTRRWTWTALIAGLFLLVGVVYWQFYRPSQYAPESGGVARLAVIPVESLNGDLEGDAFSQGFTQMLVERVSKLGGVQMISPSTVERYRRVRVPTALMARLLGLHVVLEGTVQKTGRDRRLSVRLTDVHSGRLIWAEGYDLPAEDPKALGEVARNVALRIGQHLRK